MTQPLEKGDIIKYLQKLYQPIDQKKEGNLINLFYNLNHHSGIIIPVSFIPSQLLISVFFRGSTDLGEEKKT